jgi:hypothetical protein
MIILDYKGWLITDTRVDHGCPLKKTDNYLTVEYIDPPNSPKRVQCTMCGTIMPDDVLVHIMNVIKFTNIYNNQ